MKERLDDKVLAYLTKPRDERVRLRLLLPLLMIAQGVLSGQRYGFDIWLPFMFFAGAAFLLAVLTFRLLTGRARF